MDHFAGLDVSVKETSVCIVDDTGRIIREVKVASEPDALLAVLRNPAYHFKRIGLEAGPLSQWLYSALATAPSAAPTSSSTGSATCMSALRANCSRIPVSSTRDAYYPIGRAGPTVRDAISRHSVRRAPAER